jgi:hypothetical protein
MTLTWILAAQTALILGLDLSLNPRLCLLLLYFLPLLGTARTPSLRATWIFGIILSVLLLAGGLIKLGQAPWAEIFVPRLLAVYPLALTAVLILRGKEFGVRAVHAVSEAASQPGTTGDNEALGRDMELGRRGLLQLTRQLSEARRASDAKAVDRTLGEIEKLLAVLEDRIDIQSGTSD